MKNLLTYEQYINENYLPYFGVKQALDDSKENDVKKPKITDFKRLYNMSPNWWTAWRKENEKGYDIEHDAFSKTYEVSKDDTILFIYDYSRYKIFTNEQPTKFLLKREISPDELKKIESSDVEDPNKKKSKDGEKEKSEEE